jgi:hypothetical protein
MKEEKSKILDKFEKISFLNAVNNGNIFKFTFFVAG